MRTTLRSIAYGIGGVPNKKNFKAVQLGDPSGGCPRACGAASVTAPG